jgi:retinoblastoma-associated protein
MSAPRKLAKVGKLLKSEAFHRALLACCVEIVFVANKIYCWLFPRSMQTFQVKPLVMFTVIGKFIAACSNLPTAFVSHLKWCEDSLVGDISWRGAGKKQELFAVLNVVRGKHKDGLPQMLSDFLERLKMLAGRKIYDLACELQLDSQDIILNHVWSTFMACLLEKFFLFQDRHIDHVIVCSFYGVCKGQGKNILFNNIIDTHGVLSQRVVSSNKDLLMIYMNSRINLRNPVSCECSEDITRDRPADFVAKTASIIGFYNHCFLPNVKDVIMKLHRDPKEVTQFPAKYKS